MVDVDRNVNVITQQYAEIIDNELHAAVPCGATNPPSLAAFHGMLQYHLGWTGADGQSVNRDSGKRIRPVLCLLCCEAAGGDYRQAAPVGAAIELLHNFSLIHDDIQDRSDERRHRPTVWKIWGEAQAINAGDAMYALALLALRRLDDMGVPATFANEVVFDLNQTLVALAQGQYLDISFEQRLDVGIEEYVAMIDRKTAALIGSAARLGALLGSGSKETAERYRSFGRDLGIAFQIQDDVLGIWGDPEETGKPAGDDIIQRKKTLPLVFAMQVADGRQKDRLQHVYAGAGVPPSEASEVRNLLERLGAKEYAEEKAREWYQAALQCLDEAGSSYEAGRKLRMLASALLHRTR